jgi:hypothetical protein
LVKTTASIVYGIVCFPLEVDGMSTILEVVGYLIGDAVFNRLVGTLRVEKPLASPNWETVDDEKNFKTLLERNSRFEDPVYKKNLQRLIERNRQFEEERNERHS